MRNIVSPIVDFFLLGGASILIIPLLMFAFPVEGITFQELTWLLMIMYGLEYITNFPHFAYSYQLMYQNFGRKIRGLIDPALQKRYIWAGIVVPVLMITFFIFGYLQNSTAMLNQAVNIMLLTAGWHYAKQGFGILIVCSVYAKVFYNTIERQILLINAHLMWIYAWILFNTGSQIKEFHGITFVTIGFPLWVELLFRYLTIAGTLSAIFVLITKYMRDRVLPPFNGLTAYIASVYLWIILRFGLGYDKPIHPIVFLIPCMHSVQYIAIVYKLKYNQMAHKFITKKAFIFFIFWGIVIGALIFEALPEFLDRTVAYDKSVFGPTLFIFVFWIFINIHHYFIDNVIWRREGSEVKNHLFA